MNPELISVHEFRDSGVRTSFGDGVRGIWAVARDGSRWSMRFDGSWESIPIGKSLRQFWEER